jgi:shikimate kinase
MNRPPPRGLILVGFMGAGKSSVGRILAERLGWAFEDLDDCIERREKRQIAEIFRNQGEAGFRRAEHQALKELLEGLQTGSEKVIALGGGAFVEQSNISLIEAAKLATIFLDADVEELWERCQQQSETHRTVRPLLGSIDDFRELYHKRRPHYLRAGLRQETSGRAVEQIAAELIQALNLTRTQLQEKNH